MIREFFYLLMKVFLSDISQKKPSEKEGFLI